MASVEKRVRDGKVTWLARWRDPDGKQRKRTFPKKSDAERRLVSIGSALEDGTYVDPSLSKVTFGDWSRVWLDGQVQLKPSTRSRYEGLLRVQVLPTWATVPLAKIRHVDVGAWTRALSAGGLSAATVRQAHRVFSLVVDYAVQDGRLARNPAKGVTLPRLGKPEKRYLTVDQVEALAEACQDRGLIVLVLAYTGLRFGELAALRVRRVDLMRGRLTVSESVTEIAGKATFGSPKTGVTRSVPVPRSLVDPLRDLMAGKGPDDLVFTAPAGGVLRLNNFRRRVFDRAASEVGLEGLTPHELRHTAASLAVSAGANVKVVQRMLGHASAAMTLDVYADLFEEDLDSVADRLDSARSRVPRVCPGAEVVPLRSGETAV